MGAWRTLAMLLSGLLVTCVCRGATGDKLKPLTEIAPTEVELGAFSATVLGALEKLGFGPGTSAAPPVIHLVGASPVEAAVDWTPVCDTGARVVLVGPQAVPLTGTGQGDCVSVVEAVYTRDAVGKSAAHAEEADPDLIVLLNADLYHIQWRRSLAELLISRKPAVLTTYCE